MQKSKESPNPSSLPVGGGQGVFKVMKFGGTSVGKPHRMHEVAKLITSDAEPKIVVLSAVSGTTNALVEIGNFLAAHDRENAKKKIDALESQYKQFITELIKQPAAFQKAENILKE